MDGYVVIDTQLNTKKFDAQIKEIEYELKQLDYELSHAKELKLDKRTIDEYNKRVEVLSNKLIDLRKKQNELNRVDFSGFKNSIDGVIKKIAKWGLALFGIRSMYMFIRQSASTLSQYNEQLATDLSYIRFALASMLQPLIERIIDLVYKLLAYVNYIAQAWFGINLFANASAKAFNKANSSANKLKKTLSSFDEMNILNKDGSVGTIGGIPSTDLSNLRDIEIPEWIKWIANNKDLLLGIATALGTAFALSKITGWLSNLGLLFTGKNGLGVLATTLGQLAVLAGGIVITGLVAKKVWDEADELKKEIKKIRNNGTKAQKEWIKNEEDLNKLIKTGNTNRQAAYELLEKSGGVWNRINGLGYENLNTARQTAINIQKQIDKEVELYKAGKLNKDEQELIKQNIIEQVKYNSQLIQKLAENGYATYEIEKLNEDLIQNYKDMGGEVEVIKTDFDHIKNVKFDDKQITIKVYGDTTSYKEAIRRAGEYAEKELGGLGFIAGGGGKGSIGGGGGGNGKWRAKGGIFYPSMLPKLAVGGIINNPGMGVPYNGAIIGERGAEAVVPLTDSQQMALLGEAIGKYITVNLTNVTELDGRTIARKVQEVNNGTNFLLNR